MTKTIRVAMAQINGIVGDLAGNAAKILAYTQQAVARQADIVAFPELAITSYPPEDLLLKPRFISDTHLAIQELATKLTGITAIVGFVDSGKRGLYNAAAIINDGWIADTYYKILLPNYGVFDEKRYFVPGHARKIFGLGECRFAVNICEDIWQPGIVAYQVQTAHARLIINISCSPYHSGKLAERTSMLQQRARANNVPVVYVNRVGGQDELVFDGGSMVIAADGSLLARASQFSEELLVVDVPVEKDIPPECPDPAGRQRLESQRFCLALKNHDFGARAEAPAHVSPLLEPSAEIYQALVTGLRDYVTKNRFKKVVIGSSGGIDSALTAVLAVDALGAENVVTVAMPSPYSSIGSVEDSRKLASNLGIPLLIVPIERAMLAFDELLAPHFPDLDLDLTKENLQARIRGSILMAFSNKFGYLVVSTGNKSELSVGYCTLYGDMVGGFAVLKDVLKTQVYEVSKYCNQLVGYDRIPEAVLTKPPSAELRPDQLDTDSLPAYEELDPILNAYIVDNMGLDDMVSLGHEPEVVKRVMRLVDQAEYKRRQGAPGIKISLRSFGKDRRVPITHGYVIK